jgi:hypothetical protein
MRAVGEASGKIVSALWRDQMSFLDDVDTSFLTEEFIQAFEKQQREDQLALEALAWLRDGAELEPDRPIGYEMELEQCYEDIMDWLRDDWESGL